jgi:hypothetical protein
MRCGAAIGIIVGALVASFGTPAFGTPYETTHIVPCTEAAPAAFSLDNAPQIDVHVHMVLDGVSLAEGRRVVARAQEAYTPLGIRLVANFTTAHIEPTETTEALAALQRLFGGQRPPWADVVFLLMKGDLSGGAGSATGGVAACIGGASWPETAFAMGEDLTLTAYGILDGDLDQGPHVVAHEIGHLFGAQHHYANCAEFPTAIPNGQFCSIMFNDGTWSRLQFDHLNTAVVRGYAEAYLHPITAQPPPDGSPTVAPTLSPCNMTPFHDIVGDQSNFVVNNPDDIDLVGGSFVTDDDGVVHFRWKIASLDSDFGPVASSLTFRLDVRDPAADRFEVTWDGENPPTGLVSQIGTEAGPFTTNGPAIMPMKATVTPGNPGYVDAELPLAALHLANKALTLGFEWAMTNVDQHIDFDTAAATFNPVTPGPCTDA